MRRLLLILGSVYATACGGDTPTARGDPVEGTYPLRSINGHPPPQIIADDADGVLSILSGVVILESNRNFVDSTDTQLVTPTGTLVEADVGRGTWRVTGDSIVYRLATGGEYAMRFDGNEMTQDFFGIILVYRR